MIANCMTPYRAHLHALIAEGIPELKLHTLITHGAADFDWSIHDAPEIHTTYFNEPGDTALAGKTDRPLQEWRKGGRLIEYLHTNNVCAVICTGYRYLSYLRVIRSCHRRRIPLFMRNDSNIKGDARLTPLKTFAKRQVYNWWMPRVAGIMSMGEYGDQFFIKYGANPSRIYRVPYTPDYEQFASCDERTKAEFCKRFKLDSGRRRMIYSGRLAPVKRVDLLVDAFAAIAHQRPDWDLLIAGDGVQSESLRERIPAALRQRVTWTGFLEREELIAAYHSAHVLVLPSDYEPWAVVIQEAMAAGLAIVATDVVGAAHELVEDRVDGRIFPAGNLQVLTEALSDVTDHDSLARYRQRSLRALAEWRERVDPVANIRRALFDVSVLRANPEMQLAVEGSR